MTERTETSAVPNGANATPETTYSYRPSLMGAGWTFRLTGTGIVWEAGSKSGRVPYRSVRRVRLSYKPASMQTHRFITEIWADGAPRLQLVSSSWKSMVEQERLDDFYAAFVRELHRHLAAAGAPVDYVRGRHPLSYWPGLVLFVLVALGLGATVVRALEAHSVGAAAVIGGFVVLFCWQGFSFFRRNRPGGYTPEALPQDLLPKG